MRRDLSRRSVRKELAAKPYGDVTEAKEANMTSTGTALLLDRITDKVRHFSELPLNWDSYGAEPVAIQAVQTGTDVLNDPLFWQLLPRHNARLAAFPRRDGGLQLEVDGGYYALEVIISAAGETEYAFFNSRNEVEQEFLALTEAADWYATQAA